MIINFSRLFSCSTYSYYPCSTALQSEWRHWKTTCFCSLLTSEERYFIAIFPFFVLIFCLIWLSCCTLYCYHNPKGNEIPCMTGIPTFYSQNLFTFISFYHFALLTLLLLFLQRLRLKVHFLFTSDSIRFRQTVWNVQCWARHCSPTFRVSWFQLCFKHKWEAQGESMTSALWSVVFDQVCYSILGWGFCSLNWFLFWLVILVSDSYCSCCYGLSKLILICSTSQYKKTKVKKIGNKRKGINDYQFFTFTLLFNI